ncbi:hypothetical protein GCM10018963_64520 [Saccharothrix longispora]
MGSTTLIRYGSINGMAVSRVRMSRWVPSVRNALGMNRRVIRWFREVVREVPVVRPGVDLPIGFA